MATKKQQSVVLIIIVVMLMASEKVQVKMLDQLTITINPALVKGDVQ